MSLLVQSYGAVLAILMPHGILLTRLIVDAGVHVAEVVAGTGRVTVHMRVYTNVLRVRTTMYPTLMVVHLSM